MLRISFVWYWNKASSVLPFWRDGLRSAMELIGKEHHVEWFLDEKIPEDKYDAYILWGDSNCGAIEKIRSYTGKKAICLSTDPTNPENLRGLDTIYCESTPVLEKVRSYGLRAIKAFGTDTDFFSPDSSIEKDIEYFYPATFSPWKRQHTLAHLGKDLLCVGTVQPDGVQELEACEKAGVQIKIGYFPVEDIRMYFNRAKHVTIPAIHGSERTVLEAMSMKILPTVAPENRKAHSYLEEYRYGPWESPREFVVANYSPEIYARQIMKGIT